MELKYINNINYLTRLYKSPLLSIETKLNKFCQMIDNLPLGVTK